MQTSKTSDLTQAYDIKNVDFRNLLTVVMGTVSNQTGESFDKAMLRTKSADEIWRRFNAIEAQRDALLAACKLAQQVIGGADTSGSGQRAAHAALFAAIASVEGKQ